MYSKMGGRVKLGKCLYKECYVDRQFNAATTQNLCATGATTDFSAQAELERAQGAQGHAQKCSPSAQVKAAPAHVQRLERN